VDMILSILYYVCARKGVNLSSGKIKIKLIYTTSKDLNFFFQKIYKIFQEYFNRLYCVIIDYHHDDNWLLSTQYIPK